MSVMQTSGPIRSDISVRYDIGCDEFVHLRGNFYEAVIDGRRCLLKMARHAGAQAKVLLKREYDMSCRLQHPFILSPLRFVDTPKGPAIVMDYVDSCTLATFLKRRPSYAVRVRLLNEIMDAVSYLHMKGILHNDLKPDNILVDSVGGHVRIIDFGLAEKASEHLTRRLGGTVGYSAPEVLKGDTQTPSTAASDVYSLGRIISDMFPHGFGLVVRKCCRKDPKKRFQSVAAVRLALKSSRAAGWCLLACLLCVMLLSFVRGCDVQLEKPQCDLSELHFKVSKPTCDEYAMVNGERGMTLGFKMKVSRSVDTTVRVVLPLFSAQTEPFPSVDENYTYRSQGAIVGEVDLSRKRQEVSFFIPFRSMPYLSEFPNDAWSQFSEWIGVLSYAVQFRVLLVDENDTAFYQSDMQCCRFDRLSDYEMIYR